jgi:epoxyqueuosine reductase
MAVLTPALIKARARELRFDLCGIAPAQAHPRLFRMRDWVARGSAGEMTYLAQSLDERTDPSAVLPTVRSVISLGVVYNTGQPYSTSPEVAGRAVVARYAWGDDYHDVLRDRLRSLVAWMAETAGPGFEAFSCVDNGPVQERVFAEQAGLGWIGKNTCLINPALGSWLFLAEVLTNYELAPDAPGIDQCGTCTRCLDACPTGAIAEPYWVDATQCLSYLTIEVRDGLDDRERASLGRQVYGCDICQDVCPWNRRAAVSDDAAWQPRAALAFPRLIDLCRMTDEAWRARLKGSAMRRAGLYRLRRSLAYAAASLDAAEAAEALDALSIHASADHHVVRDAIAWAREPRAAPASADDPMP